MLAYFQGERIFGVNSNRGELSGSDGFHPLIACRRRFGYLNDRFK